MAKKKEQGRQRRQGGAGTGAPARDRRRLRAAPRSSATEDEVRAEAQEGVRHRQLDGGAAASRRSCSTWAWARRSRTSRSSTTRSRSWRRSPASGRRSPAPRSRSPPSSCARACRSAAGSRCAATRMWEFLDRLIIVALPRVRDFRGVPTKSFDGRGNYTLGIRDHLIFPEIDYNKVEKTKGMNITIVTTAGNDERALYPAARARHAVRAGLRRGDDRGDRREDREDPEEAEVQQGAAAQPLQACAAARAASCASSGSAASASAIWRCRATCPGVIKASW